MNWNWDEVIFAACCGGAVVFLLLYLKRRDLRKQWEVWQSYFRHRK